jgi:hypothetical protein
MGKALWRIRAARKSDRAKLKGFECARDASRAQVEVENFVRFQVFDWAFEPRAQDGDPRLLLLLDDRFDLIGVAAHERKTLKAPDGETFPASKLEVVALSKAWQGKAFSDGTRASDVLMSALMKDISGRVPPRDARVFALVHEDNKASIKLLKRYGLVYAMDRLDKAYLRLITAHRR